MSYITVADLRTYRGIDSGADDGLLAALIAAAQKAIDGYTRRVFEAAADATRTLDAVRMVEGRTLYLDRDLCAITSVTNNADGTAEALTVSTHYTTLPRNETPYWALVMKGSTGKYWRYTSDPESAIVIVGKWAYSATPPADIQQACRRLAGYLYQLKDSQVYDVTADMSSGALIIPKGIPADVKALLDPYRKVIV